MKAKNVKISMALLVAAIAGSQVACEKLDMTPQEAQEQFDSITNKNGERIKPPTVKPINDYPKDTIHKPPYQTGRR